MGIVGRSPAIQQIRETIRQVAPTNIAVLITGESGSGKELVARALHELSPRRGKPLIIVNCGAIPEGILESELFGHQKGAFTGAVESRKGYFELANGGTIFLDEIGEMPLHTQVKLLRVLEDKEFMRVGGSQPLKVDVRIIAATNKDLQKAVQQGSFRADLYYRLNAIQIHVPPLRERKEDIPLLVEKFAQDFCRENNILFEGFTDGAMEAMKNHPWPGNVRELKNFVEKVIVLEKGGRIDEADLLKYLSPHEAVDHTYPVPLHVPPDKAERELIYRVLLELKSDMEIIKNLLMRQWLAQPRSLKPWIPAASEVPVTAEEVGEEESGVSLKEMERNLIKTTLDKCKGNRRKAARILKISERTLYRKLKEYGLD